MAEEDGAQGVDRLVVVGSSAGGIEALSVLVSTMTEEFPAPIVIAQHLEASHPSHLAQILTRHSLLSIRTVAEPGTAPLDNGVVYVVPANRNVEITDHAIRLQEGETGHPTPSIDLLLSSAAQIFGEGLIAVILTGMGTDGVEGARAVHDAGGTIIVQNPATARYPALPASLIPGTVDIVANLEDIGPLLSSLLSDPAILTEEPDAEEALGWLLNELRDRYGIDFSRYKRPTIIRRLHRRLAATHQKTLLDYLRYLHANPVEYQHLVGSFLIKVTEFFRDPQLFDHLRNQTLPALAEEGRQRDRTLRFWSAGCATGEEPYSLAISLAEVLGSELDSFHVRIFATDIDPAAVAYARRGLYPAAALTNLPRELIDRYFTEVDGSYEINKRIRALTVFGEHDLAERSSFPRIDLLMCRNVLIYFAGDLQRRALRLFAYSLRPGGYLVLGTSESAGGIASYVTVDDAHLKVFRRNAEQIAVPGATREIPRMAPAMVPRSLPSGQPRGRRAEPQSAKERAWEALLALPVGVVCVDRQYDIQLINNAARQLLGIHGTVTGEDFIHIAEALPPRELRALIDATFRGDTAQALDEVPIETTSPELQRHVRITAYLPTEGGEHAIETVVVMISEVTAAVQQRQSLRQAMEQRDEQTARLQEQVQRLTRSNQELTAANRDLVAESEELRITNDEFLVGNEELQAASEEVETLNEELQATNEELETLNEELQATIEELDATNEDLQARSGELQELADSLDQQSKAIEIERARLAAILASMGEAVLVVNAQGAPALTNAAFDEMFPNGIPDVLEDGLGRPLPSEETPQARAARGEPFRMEFSISGPRGEHRWLEVTGQPIWQKEGERGEVITIRDITDRNIHQLQDAFLAVASHELRTPLTVLLGYLNLLIRGLDRGQETGRLRQYAEVVLEQIRRLELLVRDLVDATRLQHGKVDLHLQRTELAPVVTRVVEATRLLAEGREIDLAMSKEPLVVRADVPRLEQVLYNLLTNAVTYAPQSRIEVRAFARDGQAEIVVRDYGPGIPAHEIPRLFSRFHTVESQDGGSSQGLGLGLYISKELVEAQGGTIAVTSVEGQGTTFTICLSLLDAGGEGNGRASPRP